MQIDTGICACGTGCGYDSFLMSGQMVSILFLPFGAECVKKHKPLSRSVVSLRVRAMSRQFNLYFFADKEITWAEALRPQVHMK